MVVTNRKPKSREKPTKRTRKPVYVDKTPRAPDGRCIALDQPQTWGDDETWTVEHIVAAEVGFDREIRKKYWKYLTKWYGYPESKDTWEGVESFAPCQFPALATFWKNTMCDEEPRPKDFMIGMQVESSIEYRMATTRATKAIIEGQKPKSHKIMNNLQETLTKYENGATTPPSPPPSSYSSRTPPPMSPPPSSFTLRASRNLVESVFQGTLSPAAIQQQRYEETLYSHGDINQYNFDAAVATVDPKLVSPASLGNNPYLFSPTHHPPVPRYSGTKSKRQTTVRDARNSNMPRVSASSRTTLSSMKDAETGRFRQNTTSSAGPVKRRMKIIETPYTGGTLETKQRYISNLASATESLEYIRRDQLPDAPFDEHGMTLAGLSYMVEYQAPDLGSLNPAYDGDSFVGH